ncbi:uncharacterized protein VP01_1528g5, partial [Puccinia sorghi]
TLNKALDYKGVEDRVPGSQGYLAADCTALVTAVKKILQLGIQELGKVQDLYKIYVNENNQIMSPTPSRSMGGTWLIPKKPTSETICLRWICEAKLVDLSICEQAFHKALAEYNNDVSYTTWKMRPAHFEGLWDFLFLFHVGFSIFLPCKGL